MFAFDLEGKLLERFFLDVPRESHYDPEKQMLVIKKQDKGFHRRFYLSSFYINDQDNFLFKNPVNKGNDVFINWINN